MLKTRSKSVIIKRSKKRSKKRNTSRRASRKRSPRKRNFSSRNFTPVPLVGGALTLRESILEDYAYALDTTSDPESKRQKMELNSKIFNEIHKDTPIQTWNEYIIANMAFLHGYYLPFYHSGQLEHGAERNLLELHKIGVFTCNGQGNVCDEHEKQRPYLNCIFKMYDASYSILLFQLLDALKRDTRIYLRYFNFADGNFFDNTQYYKQKTVERPDGAPQIVRYMPLTRGSDAEGSRDFTLDIQRGKEFWQRFYTRAFSKLGSFRHLIFMDIAMTEFCDDLADEHLLKFMQALHFPIVYEDPFENSPADQEYIQQYISLRKSFVV
jgi:hypothetical protein